MILRTAIQILLHERAKYAGVVMGVTMALFLVLLQCGFYFGFRRDITVMSDSFEADLWVSQRELLAFDYVAHFDDLVYWDVVAERGVDAAMPVIADWSRVRRLPDGATESGEIIGIDPTSAIRVNLGTEPDLDLASELTAPGNVLVDEKHRIRICGTAKPTTGVEIAGLNANIIGEMRDKKLFTTACLLVTDLDNARRFLGLPANRITYVAVKCTPGTDVGSVKQRLQARLPHNRVWTAKEFHDLTQGYWVKLTGIGPVLLLSAGLAGLVGFVTVFLTFSNLTAEKLPVYAGLKAMGASTSDLSVLVLIQIVVVFCLGCLLALAGLLLTLVALAESTISIVMSPGIVVSAIFIMALCCLGAGLRAVWKLARVEPAEAFRT